MFSLQFSLEDFQRSVNRTPKSPFQSEFLALSIMDLAIILDIIILDIFTVRDITRQDTIGGLPGMCITGILIGTTVTGGIVAGTGIEI